MSKDIEILEGIVKHCKLDQPVPDEVQERLYARKQQNLKRVLKKTGGYSFIFGSIISIFYFVKKFGLSISLIKSAIAFWVAAALATASITTGVYLTGTYIKEQFDKSTPVIEENVTGDKKGSNNIKSREKKRDDIQTGKKEALSPLDKLRQQGHSLFMFYLKDGTRMGGSVVFQDKSAIKLNTGDAVITLKKEDIIRRLPMK